MTQTFSHDAIEVAADRLISLTSASGFGPLSRAEALGIVELIATCPERLEASIRVAVAAREDHISTTKPKS